MAKKRTTKKTPGRKKVTTKAPKSKSVAERDERTAERLTTLADGIVKSAMSGREPKVEVPTRSAGNTRWNKSRGILQMGSGTQERQLFNLGQARKFMQTLLHGEGIKDLIAQGKTTSLR
ncbi:MAG: DNA topoisomerase VI, partial [Planctomycetota bacterium]